MEARGKHTGIVVGLLLLLWPTGAIKGMEGWPPEDLRIFTDRNFYVVSEELRFHVASHGAPSSGGDDWSKVVYLELVAADGRVYHQSKHPMVRGVSTGAFTLPEGLLSGDYYLRAYTRWMRNRGPASFSYLSLRIVNPFVTQVLPPHENGLALKDAPGESRRAGVHWQVEDSILFPGKTLQARLVLDPSLHLDSLVGCVSLVPEGSLGDFQGGIRPEDAQKKASTEQEASMGLDAQTGLPGYLPELRGPSISGRVTDSSGMARPFVPVYLSLLGGQRDFFAGMSDAEGRFALPLPAYAGSQEMIVVPGPVEGTILVRIDQDYEQERYPMPRGTFKLTEQERTLGAMLARRRQLQELFPEPAKALPQVHGPMTPFYGTPSTRVELGDYVDLPTLEEVLVNLVPGVFVLKRKGKRFMSFQGGHSAMEVYAPLLMIDYIPVFDQERLMDLDPQKLSRIDLINEVYVRGGHSFGGLMNIISRKGDMAGIDLSPGSYFFDYPGLQEASRVLEQAQTGDRVPETRNTLLWMDRVSIRPGSVLELQSELPAQGGNYELVFRGRGPRGEVFCSRIRIRSLRALP